MKKSKFLFFGPFEWKNLEWSNFSAPPLGVHRVATHIRKYGHHADVVDPDLEEITEENFKRFIKKQQYDFIGISPTHITLENDLGLAYLAKKYSPESVIIAGGPEATFAYDLVMDNSPVEAVVIGEGERPALGLANARREGNLEERFGTIEGLILKNRKGKIKTGDNRALNNEEFVEVTMAMDFSQIPYNRYWESIEKFYKADLESPDPQLCVRRQQEIYTIRLFQVNYCPYNCTFCGSRNFQDRASGGARTRVVSLSGEQLVDLIEKGYNAHPRIQTVIFQDDNFMLGLKDKKIEKMLGVMNWRKQQRYIPESLSFIAQSRVDNVNLKGLRMLKEANFRLISYGVESFSQRMLEEVCKETTVERTEQTLQDTLSVGIKPYLNIILTAPNSTFYDMFETIDRSVYYLGKGAEVGSYNCIIPLPGSKIEEMTRNSDLVGYRDVRIGFTNYTFKKAERLLPINPKLREMIYRFDQVINDKKIEFMNRNKLGHLPISLESTSSKATRVNTLIRFATLYDLAKTMNIQPYGDMANEEIPRIESMLDKF